MSRPAALVAVFVVAVAGMVAARLTGSGPALYDGVCVPVSYASFGSSPAPGSARTTVPASQGEFPTKVVATDESTPQAQAIFGNGTFAVSALPVTISITAVAAPSVAPPKGQVDGNVYAYTVTGADGALLQPAAGKPVTITLEAPPSTGQDVTIDRYDGHTWTALATQMGNCGTLFEAVAPALGDFALVTASSSTGGGGTPSTPNPGAPVGLIAGVGVVVGVAILTAGTRRRRTGR